MKEKADKLVALALALHDKGYTILSEEIVHVATYGDRAAVEGLYGLLKGFY